MEEARPYTSGTKWIHMRDMLMSKNDVEFIMEHLNDPHFDLTQLPSSVIEIGSTNEYVGDDDSGAINVDKSVTFHPSLLIHIQVDNNIL